jgi:hypothetical protein
VLEESNVVCQPHASVPPVPDLNLTENCHRDDAYYRAFQNLFGVFKHQAPQLASLGDVQALVDLADKYDSLPVVSQAVRLHLMESRGKPAELYLQIAKEPRIFLSIGEKIRSSIIVKEAAIHIIGTWSVTEKPCQDLVSDRLFDALAKAADALHRKQERANTLLLSLDYEPPIPVTPNNLYQASSALIMLRDSIGKAFGRCYQQHQPELCQGMLYREIATIPHFDKPRIPSPYYPATIESHKVSFEDGCSQLKDKIQLALGDLAQCYARVTPAEIGSNYLMCGRLDDADLPWNGEGY